jgi:hypothetical protein
MYELLKSLNFKSDKTVVTGKEMVLCCAWIFEQYCAEEQTIIYSEATWTNAGHMKEKVWKDQMTTKSSKELS